jgi:peptidoglycan/xylan/chitin deacetylase (PgdA/CDA1 family)
VNPDPKDRLGFGLSTTPALFRGQMQYLANHGFHVITLHEAVAAIAARQPLPPRSVMLTFDDGYADFFEAAMPVMREHDFTATVFVITGRIGWSGFLSWSQIRAADTMGFTIGAHTVDHVALAGLPPARSFWQIHQSKLTLETGLGHAVLDFAYPFGSFNAYTQSAARKIGFETAVSTLTGSWHRPDSLMYLARLRVGGNMPMARYAQLVGGPPPTAADLAY